jgi:hypothetical protein
LIVILSRLGVPEWPLAFFCSEEPPCRFKGCHCLWYDAV